MSSRIRESRSAEFIVVGNELLNGTTLDTNSAWLSKELVKLGAVVRRKITVPDDLEEISSTFRLALRRKPGWIFSIGGLGPTFDDKTVEGLAIALGRKVRMNRVAILMIRQSYKRRPEDLGVSKEKLPTSSLKMALLPEDAKPLKNRAGTAPGVFCTFRSTQIVALPGVPKEMKTIFFEQIEPMLRKSLPHYKEMEQWMKIVGVGEPKIAPYLSKIMKKYSPEIYVKSHAMGFRKGKSILEIQLIATVSLKYSTKMCGKLMSASNDMRNVAFNLGGIVETISLPHSI